MATGTVSPTARNTWARGLVLGQLPSPLHREGPDSNWKPRRWKPWAAPPGLAVGLEHEHLQAMAGGDGGGAEATDAAAHNDQIRHRPSLVPGCEASLSWQSRSRSGRPVNPSRVPAQRR